MIWKLDIEETKITFTLQMPGDFYERQWNRWMAEWEVSWVLFLW